jgi:hypothetical protein
MGDAGGEGECGDRERGGLASRLTAGRAAAGASCGEDPCIGRWWRGREGGQLDWFTWKVY